MSSIEQGVAERATTRENELAAARPVRRLAQLDGLRGAAALIVVVFHYMAMLHPRNVPDFAQDPSRLADTPLGILWNGPFAVFVFFVLSGFVIAGAAARRSDQFAANTVSRYVRLAIPMLASVLLAYALLSVFPTAAQDLAASLDAPSGWLSYTAQAPLPSLPAVLYEGALGSFLSGGSALNNVLWTMQIELLGSLALFAIYWAGAARVPVRFLLLAVFAAIGLLVLGNAYLCFVTGALLYEAHRRGMLARVPAWASVSALAAGVLIGAPGEGFAARMGLDALPGGLHPGNPWGLAPVVAATLIVFATLRLAILTRLFSATAMQWLGRVSFALYLVHVPLLYTVVAWERVTLGLPEILVAVLYGTLVLGLAHLFTVAVDEPTIRLLPGLRNRLPSPKNRAAASAVCPGNTGRADGERQPLWPWVLGASAVMMLPALANGVPFLYFDSVGYISRPSGFLDLLSRLPFVDLPPPPEVPAPPQTAVPGAGNPAPLTEDGPRVEHRGRSMYYRIVGWTALVTGQLWPLVALHAAMASFALALVWSRVAGWRVGWGWLGLVVVLTFFTPLGLFVGMAMPDILAGILVLCVVSLMLGWDALDRGERLALAAIAMFAMVSHLSHMLLGFGLAMPLYAARARAASAGRGVATVMSALVVAAALETGYGWMQTRGGDVVLLSRPHIVAHLIDDGPAVGYLQRTCPKTGFAMCRFAGDLPVDWIAFLFDAEDPEQGLYASAPGALQIAITEEQLPLAWAVLVDDPIGVIGFAFRASVEQMVRFGVADVPITPEEFERFGHHFPERVAEATRMSPLFRHFEVLRLVTATTWTLVAVTFAMGAISAWRMAAGGVTGQQRTVIAAVAAILAGLVLNAVICGVLASPYERFQARIVWLWPLAMFMLALGGGTALPRTMAGTAPDPRNVTETRP